MSVWLVTLCAVLALNVILVIPAQGRASLCETAIVTRAIDGDTIVVRCGAAEYKIRMIGVDTPESVHPRKPVECYGLEASKHTKAMLTGRTVRLEYGKNALDKYGRVLAYVFVGKVSYNGHLIRRGFAKLYDRFSFARVDLFRRYQKQAQKEGAGLWGACPAQGE